VDVFGGWFRLVASHSGKCLDVYGAGQQNGARVIQWNCHGGPNQRWRQGQN
jgi:glucosylceramidase